MDLYSILGQQISVQDALPQENASEVARGAEPLADSALFASNSASNSPDAIPADSTPAPSPVSSPLIESTSIEEDVLAMRLQAEARLAALLSAVVERVRYITSASGVALALCEGEEDAMVCHAASGPAAPEVGARMYIRSGLTAESIRTRQTLRCDRASTDPRVNHESCKALGIESVMVMPLILARNVVGMLELFGAKASAFAERDAKTLRASMPQVDAALREAVGAGMNLGRIPWAEEAPDTSATADDNVITLKTPVAFPIDSFRKPESPETTEHEVPAFLARLADEARPASNRSWSQWFRPQW